MSTKLFVEVEFDIDKGTFKHTTNIKANMLPEVVSDFLRYQMGAGKDESKANDQDLYHIRVELDLSFDIFSVTRDDTGNKGLRDGILYKFLDSLPS